MIDPSHHEVPDEGPARPELSRRGSLTRREMLGSAALLFAAGCERPRPTGYPGTALVGVGGEHAVALVDLNTFRPAGRLDLRGEPSAVAADSDRGYVLTGSNGTVHFIDCTHKMRAGSWQLSGNLNLLRLTPQRGQIVVSSAGDQELVIADAVHRKVTRRVKLASAPVDADVRLEPNSKKLYAALSGGRSGTLELVDIESGSHRKREIGGELGSIRFRNDGQLLFAGRYNDNTLVVLDTRTLETVCELPLPIRPENFSFSADQGQLFISGSGMDGVSIVFAYDTIEVEQTVLAGYQPGAMVCSKRPNYLFVASRAGSELTILNVDSRKVVALTQVGDKPTRIAITEDQQYALVLNEGSGDLAVIRIPAIGNMRSKSGAGSLPSGILTLRGISLFAMIPIGQKPTDLAIFTERA